MDPITRKFAIRSLGCAVSTVMSTGGCELIYRTEHVQKALSDMQKKSASQASVMVDCSHGNSSKNHLNQPKVASDVAKQIAAGEEGIVGIM